NDSSIGENASTTYLWSYGTGDYSIVQNTSIVYDPDDAGDELVCLTITNHDNGCASTYCRVIDVQPLCQATNFTYTAQGRTCTFTPWVCGDWDSITWNFGDGTIIHQADSALTHTFPVGTDSFNVVLTIDYGSVCQHYYHCIAIYNQEVYLNTTGINSVAANNELSVYPNPVTSSSFTVSGPVKPGSFIEIYDATGRLLSRIAIKSPEQLIDASQLPAGMYTLSVIATGAAPVSTGFMKF
ncbi:MAG TPA: T9SS type A sorting domain-containing protein, partial [Chitinophagales bacterium]|nr:T9SS type A sorting domain-containing protein [Chitinophagales bacterium]